MVGFSLLHAGPGALLIPGTLAGIAWVVAVLIATLLTRRLGGKVIAFELVAFALAMLVITLPYGFWQRLFISKFTQDQAIDFFTRAAATGDLRTVEAFLKRGVPINPQGRYGTARGFVPVRPDVGAA